MSDDELLRALERTRAGYSDERAWHRFLLDAYTGGGGFQGSVRQPDVGWWGAAAERYAPWGVGSTSSAGPSAETYLDRFPREDEPKFHARKAVAHYSNYVEPLTNLKISYLLRKPFAYEKQPAELAAWRENLDGRGTTWRELRPLVALMAAIWGWTPVLIDMDPAAPGMSRAQADAAGVGRPRFVPLTPAALVDFLWRDGDWVWAKIRTDHVEQLTWNSEPIEVARYATWTPRDVTVFEVRSDAKGAKSVTQAPPAPNPFGRVPLAIFKHHVSPGDDVRGLPMHGAVAKKSKRLFNLDSELDEHIRGQVFALLVLASKGRTDQGEIQVGTDNAIYLDADSSQKHYYLSPDTGVAATLETRIENVVREIYRMARVEYARATASAVSGIARAYEFGQTNRALADFANELARGEEWMDSLVWAGLGKDPAALKGYRAVAPDNFDVEDLAQELKAALDAVSLKIGPTATKRLKLRVVQRLLPQLSADDLSAIEGELDEVAAQEEADAAMTREMLGGGGGAPGGADDEPDQDEADVLA